MLGEFAEFETNLRKERQAEGIAAKARGVYKGRKPKIDTAVVHKLRYEEMVRPILRDGSALAGQASIACSGRRGRHKPCQSARSCDHSIPRTGAN